MNRELEQNAADVLSLPAVQKGVATATIGTGFAAALNWIPDLVAILSGIGGLIILYTIYRKNRAEERKFNAQAEILESRERARKEEMQTRFEKGDPCRRCTDEIPCETKEVSKQ